MIYLFSNIPGVLRQGAAFFQLKSRSLSPADDPLYLMVQQGPYHNLTDNLGPNSDFTNVNCSLAAGEVAIIIGHGTGNNTILDEAGVDVTAAVLRLLTKLATDNNNRNYKVFLAVCGGGLRQPGQPTSLLTALVRATPALAQQLSSRQVSCFGYSTEAGLVNLPDGVPINRRGTHIYGWLRTPQNVEMHCGYDARITAQLSILPDGRYAVILFAGGIELYQNVTAWVAAGYKPDMQTKFPKLHETVRLTI